MKYNYKEEKGLYFSPECQYSTSTRDRQTGRAGHPESHHSHQRKLAQTACLIFSLHNSLINIQEKYLS